MSCHWSVHDLIVSVYINYVAQVCPEKEEPEAWLIKEMDRLLAEVWHTGNDELFQQIMHLILSENVTG